MLPATAWLIEKPQTTPTFFIVSAKQACLSNIPIIFMTVPYVICIGSSIMKNYASDGITAG